MIRRPTTLHLLHPPLPHSLVVFALVFPEHFVSVLFLSFFGLAFPSSTSASSSSCSAYAIKGETLKTKTQQHNEKKNATENDNCQSCVRRGARVRWFALKMIHSKQKKRKQAGQAVTAGAKMRRPREQRSEDPGKDIIIMPK